MYKLLFAGKVLPGHDRDIVRARLANILKIDEHKVERLFSGSRLVIRKDADEATARRYQQAFAKAGAELIVDPPLPGSEPPAPVKQELTLSAVEHPPAVASEAPEEDPYQSPQGTVAGTSKFCRHCGAAMAPGQAFCTHCGQSQGDGEGRSKIVAGILAILLGGLGVHRLYLGQWWGIFYIILPFTSVVALVEGIVFLLASDDSWKAKYGNVQGSKMLLLLLIPALFFGIAIIGILAAVAIPAYQDYTMRANVTQAVSVTAPLRVEVAEFVDGTGFMPSGNLDVGWEESLEPVSGMTVTLEDGARMVLTWQSPAALAEQTLVFTPVVDGRRIVDWACTDGGSLLDKYRPPQCRGGKRSGNSSSGSTSPAMSSSAIDWESRQFSNGYGGHVLMEVPEVWQPMAALASAEIGIGSDLRMEYMTVVVEPKTDFEPGFGVEGYTDLVVNYTLDDLGDLHVMPDSSVTINGMPAIMQRVDGTAEGLRISYLMATVEGYDHFYKLMCWSSQRQFSKAEPVCRRAIMSLAEGAF